MSHGPAYLRLRIVAGSGVLASVLCAALPLHAQSTPKRLSEWLLEQPLTLDAYHLGLSWRVAGEVPAQHALQQALLQALSGENTGVRASSQIKAHLRTWVATLPVTGRVPVSVTDARWLQANPIRDPVLLAGHSVVLPKRPTTVTVVTGDGTRCFVSHVPEREAGAYLNACKVVNADWAWIAQPDGRVQRFGVASWNREVQDFPAPGSWIWAPPRNSGWSDRFSQQLITFLATQGPAPDPTQKDAKNKAPLYSHNRRVQTSAGGASQGYRVQMPSDEHASADSSSPDSPQTIAGLSREAWQARSRNPEVSSSDWGYVGLLQTPTARMYPAGHFSFSFSRTQPYTRGNLFFQPLDWFEAGFRYIDISNRLYDPTGAFNTTQSNKDKSIDFKVRLRQESAYLPQVAVGLRDAAGTGFFSGEYVVANKRFDAFDFSLGLAWGNLAGQTRNIAFGQGGNFSIKNYFRGTPKPFGGVQYQTPFEKVTLKLEYDSNSYQNEPQANNQKRSSPWNFGVVYKAAKSVDFTLGVERGNTVMLGFALHTQLDGLSQPKVHDPPLMPVTNARPEKSPVDWKVTAQAIQGQSGWQVHSIETRSNELHVVLDDASAMYWRDRVDKIAAVLHFAAPASIDRFVLRYNTRGATIAEHVIDRDAWVKPRLEPVPPGERQNTIVAQAPVTREQPAQVHHVNARPPLDHNLRLGYGQTLGGPDAFLLFQFYAQETARLWLRDDTWIDGSLRLRLVDNYNKYKQLGSSNIPRVRTYLREYLTTSRVTIPNLQVTHTGKLTDNQYYSAYAGYLEEAFAGVGGEWLYRPFASRIAFGIDANLVKQRNFRQDFGFDKADSQTGYRTFTGHGTLYWDTGWNDIHAIVSVGKYLARDSGATLQLARTFQNGVTLGAFATKTNITAEQFGEGSFDKGLFLSIPFDAILTRSTGISGTFSWRPLTRDGGAFLARSNTLYGMSRVRSDRALETKPAPLPDESLPPADRQPQWTPKTAGPEPYTRVTQRPSAAQFEPGTSHEFRMTEALYGQGYRNIKIVYNQSNQLTLSLSNGTIAPASRAIGRAMRTVLPLAPLETREIKVIFATRTDPVVTYEFVDLDRLNRYFGGTVTTAELSNYVSIKYLNPAARQNNPLERFDDLDTEAKAPIFAAVVPETVSAKRVVNDFGNAGRMVLDTDWMRMGVAAAGAVLASSAMDKRAFRFAKDHQNNSVIRNEAKVGNALPWIGLVGAGLVALDGSDPKRSRTGFAAAEAGASALLLSTGLKYAFGRSRPEDGLGTHNFNSFSSANNNSSFPSRHASVAWAVTTPFAQEYDMPWLYVLPALTTIGRVGNREHWVSDAVAGSLLGYGLGRLFWESSRADNKYAPRIGVTRNGVTLAWETP